MNTVIARCAITIRARFFLDTFFCIARFDFQHHDTVAVHLLITTLAKVCMLRAYTIATLCAFLFLPASFAGETPPASITLPDIGDASSVELSIPEERKLGEAFMRSIRQNVKLIDDPLTNDYIKSLGNLLVGFAGYHPLDFSFFVVDDGRINAFAGPGGYVGVNSGLILASESESELASVLAHELAHVTQRHLLRSFEAASKMSLPTAAALIAAIILGAHNPQAAEALLAAGIASGQQSQLNFSRLHEQEADRVGIETLSQAGFDARAMPVFFERLQQASRGVESGAPEFLSTHPVTLGRIADSRGRAEQFPFRQYSDSVEYHLIRARLAYLSDTRPAAQRVKTYATNLKSGKYRSEIALRYAYALALTDHKDFSGAREQLAQLLKRDTERVAYFAAQADIEGAAGDPAKSISILNHALRLYPHDTPLTFKLAETYLTSGDLKQARAVLLEQERFEQGNPVYYHLLARVAERANDAQTTHEALAEFHYLYGRIPLAIEHLQTALRLPGLTFYIRSRIEARERVIQDEMRPAQAGKTGNKLAAVSACGFPFTDFNIQHPGPAELFS